MAKEAWKPGTMIYPLPAVLVSCGNARLGDNIITIAWTGTLCTDPPLCYISVRPERFSYGLIKAGGEYVINLTTRALAFATDWCGVKSGRDQDKFKAMGLTREKARVVSAPLIAQSPLNIECRVREVVPLGSHHMFVSEVVAVNADAGLMNPATGAFQLSHADPICYAHGRYYQLGRMLGTFGFSVRKKPKTKARRKL
ncbi:flavin reductase family protein [Desulfatitalea alkaliphila]|uniref:Flavin reductase family protein n=1 Tax=Desulfatitalea alkaliphila TaxID=2929485 RepID=A0AA41UID9_9BACT|nr:flavin reductase family protein [Desulfatitalea alkaliphila]MCJ8499497.1 flavin reductase family protein [Desulfatitalea alkaliphila]